MGWLRSDHPRRTSLRSTCPPSGPTSRAWPVLQATRVRASSVRYISDRCAAMKRAALYMRVSTVDQHPETQLHDLRQMAAQRGYQIVAEFTDRISGAKARRPGLDQLMKEARRSRFDVVLVWASDRIARSVKHFLDILDELNRLNIEFVSFREQIDTAGPLGWAIGDLMRRYRHGVEQLDTLRRQLPQPYSAVLFQQRQLREIRAVLNDLHKMVRA